MTVSPKAGRRAETTPVSQQHYKPPGFSPNRGAGSSAVGSGAGRPDHRGDPVAFTTGQTARYCFVTADTILNWIRAGSLAAQRTAGGQYRIRLGDLRDFMRAHGMSTELLEAELHTRPYCWEHFCQGAPSAGCQACIVYRSCALDCAALGDHVDRTRSQNPRCETCEYRERYIPAERGTPEER